MIMNSKVNKHWQPYFKVKMSLEILSVVYEWGDNLLQFKTDPIIGL